MAGLVEGDYRMDGKMELIVCSTDGEGIELSNLMCLNVDIELVTLSYKNVYLYKRFDQV